MTEIPTIDLSSYTLLDSYGLERRDASGVHTSESLSQLIIDEWVPFYECHKCSRVDYCKFPEPVAPGAPRMREIRCGVVVASIENFVKATFPSLDNFNHAQVQGYLDGAFHLARFLFDAEVRIGSAMDANYVDYLEDWAPAFFGRFVHLRDHLNEMSAALSGMPELRADKGILLVEGHSEKAFIERLRLSHIGWFIDLQVDTYEGKGSRGPTRLEMLLRRFGSQGYKPYIQGDADGGSAGVFDALIQRDLVERGSTFVFEYDFERAVPNRLAYAALSDLGLLEDIEFEEYDKVIGINRADLFNLLSSEFAIEIEDIKIDFAQTVANIVNWSWDWSWWRDEEFLKSELGRFLEFLRAVN